MLLELDGTLVVLAFSFIIFMIIMQKLFYSPLQEVRNNREEYINVNKLHAKGASEEAENLLENYNDQIAKARIKSTDIVKHSTFESNREKSRIIENASFKALEQMNEDRKLLLQEKINAVKVLKPQVISLANNISSKILGEVIPVTGITSEQIDELLNR